MSMIVIAVVAFGVIALIAWWIADQRRKELSAWGQAHGFSFDPEKVRDLDRQYPAFECLRKGSNRYAYNRLTGDWNGWRCFAFDYHYQVQSGKNTNVYTFSAVIVASPIPLKPLLIRPEGLFDKVAEFFGFEDINFESAEFSRAFFVKSPDKKWAFDVIHQQTMEFLLAAPRFTLQFDRDCAIILRDATFRAADFGAALDVLTGVLGRLPDYLVKQQTG